MPAWLTMAAVSSRVMPMKATFSPLTSMILVAGKTVSRSCALGSFHSRSRRGTGSRRPGTPGRRGRSSGRSRRRGRRRGSRPAACAAARGSPRRTRGCRPRRPAGPIWFIALMAGSSWKAAESSGEAPMRSPAATVIGVGPRGTGLLALVAEQRAEVRRAAGRGVVDPAARAARRGHGLEVAVEVVDGEQVELDVVGRAGPLAGGPARAVRRRHRVVDTLGVGPVGVAGRGVARDQGGGGEAGGRLREHGRDSQGATRHSGHGGSL